MRLLLFQHDKPGSNTLWGKVSVTRGHDLASVPLRASRRTEIDSRPSKLSWYGGTGLVVLWLDFDGGDSNQEIRLPDVIRSGRE